MPPNRMEYEFWDIVSQTPEQVCSRSAPSRTSLREELSSESKAGCNISFVTTRPSLGGAISPFEVLDA